MNTIIKGLICLSLSVALVACGHGWQHGQVPESKWDKDYADCVHQAESAARHDPRDAIDVPRIGQGDVVMPGYLPVDQNPGAVRNPERSLLMQDDQTDISRTNQFCDIVLKRGWRRAACVIGHKQYLV